MSFFCYRHDPSSARLIFGYSACLDVAVKAKDFIPRVMEEYLNIFYLFKQNVFSWNLYFLNLIYLFINRFGIENPKPTFHSRLETAKDFVESFLLFYRLEFQFRIITFQIRLLECNLFSELHIVLCRCIAVKAPMLSNVWDIRYFKFWALQN